MERPRGLRARRISPQVTPGSAGTARGRGSRGHRAPFGPKTALWGGFCSRPAPLRLSPLPHPSKPPNSRPSEPRQRARLRGRDLDPVWGQNQGPAFGVRLSWGHRTAALWGFSSFPPSPSGKKTSNSPWGRWRRSFKKLNGGGGGEHAEQKTPK